MKTKKKEAKQTDNAFWSSLNHQKSTYKIDNNNYKNQHFSCPYFPSRGIYENYKKNKIKHVSQIARFVRSKIHSVKLSKNYNKKMKQLEKLFFSSFVWSLGFLTKKMTFWFLHFFFWKLFWPKRIQKAKNFQGPSLAVFFLFLFLNIM